MTQHYNFYESLGLNNTESSDQLAAEFSAALQALEEQGASMSNPRYHEAATARTILGQERLRAKYDARLADSAAQPMRIGDLIYLAQHGEFPQPQHPAPRPAAFAIETRKVEELEPTGRPLARLKLAPGVVKTVLGIAAVVPAVMTLGFVLMAIVSAVDSARSSAYSGGGFLDEFATVLDSSLTSFYLLVLAVFVLVNILWSLRVIQDVLYPQRGGQNVVLAVAALGFAVVELFVMVGVGAADWVMFALPFLAHTAVGSLLFSGFVGR
ncbi:MULTISPECIES: hypothetical protein [unclassified Corynebacterium]